jgi:methylphosphotriester-DNA--protein-cysteine methyltransferase
VSSNGSSGPARRVLVVGGGEMFHRPSCDMVTGKDAKELTVPAARKRGLRPCPACEPATALTAS